MNYHEFKRKIAAFPVFSTSHLNSLAGNTQVLKNQLTKWQKRGLVVKLRKGLYMLGESDRKLMPSRLFLANQLYQPSYISVEYALAFYELIPERVYDITSVSTKKTTDFKNVFGNFIYQHIKTSGFNGYQQIIDENGFNCFIAEPEKALIDYCYLNSSLFKTEHALIFDSLRLQNLESLNTKRLTAHVRGFGNRHLTEIARSLVNYIKEAE